LHQSGLSHLFRVYVRHAEHAAPIADALQRAVPGSRAIFLAADICRTELLLEIEALIQPRGEAAVSSLPQSAVVSRE
jgi:hypothetical protein